MSVPQAESVEGNAADVESGSFSPRALRQDADGSYVGPEKKKEVVFSIPTCVVYTALCAEMCFIIRVPKVARSTRGIVHPWESTPGTPTIHSKTIL